MNEEKTSVCSILALVLAIIAILASILVVGLLFALPAIVCGHAALSIIHRENGQVGGKGLAIAGLVLGYVAAAVSLVVLAAGLLFAITMHRRMSPGKEVSSQIRELRSISSSKAYDQVLEQLSVGKQESAEMILDALCQEHPNNQRLLFAKAVCARSRFWMNLSTPLMAEVLRMNPKSVEGQCAGHVLSMDSGKDFDGNFSGLSALVDKSPQNPLILWMLAVECRQHAKTTGKHTYSEKGAECYRKLLEQWKVGPVLVHQTYANLLSEELGRHEEALAHRRLAIQLEPAGWTFQGLGNTLVRLERYEEANMAFLKCAELSPQEAQYWRNWAWSLHLQKKPEASIAKCRKATELDPKDESAWTIWGDNLVELGRTAEAIAKYEQHMKYHPDDANISARLESARTALPREKENRRRFEALKRVTPDSVRRVDIYVPFRTTILFSTTSSVSVADLCAACAGIESTNISFLSSPIATQKGTTNCDVIITMNGDIRHEITVWWADDNPIACGRIISTSPDRRSGEFYGDFTSRALRDWMKANLRVSPRPTRL